MTTWEPELSAAAANVAMLPALKVWLHFALAVERAHQPDPPTLVHKMAETLRFPR